MTDDELLTSVRLFLAACSLLLGEKALPLRVYTILEDVLNEHRKEHNRFAVRMYSQNQHNFLKALSLAHKAGYLSVEHPGLVRINLPTFQRIQYEAGFRDAHEVAKSYLMRMGL